jgi:hypothetical protein
MWWPPEMPLPHSSATARVNGKTWAPGKNQVKKFGNLLLLLQLPHKDSPKL